MALPPFTAGAEAIGAETPPPTAGDEAIGAAIPPATLVDVAGMGFTSTVCMTTLGVIVATITWVLVPVTVVRVVTYAGAGEPETTAETGALLSGAAYEGAWPTGDSTGALFTGEGAEPPPTWGAV